MRELFRSPCLPHHGSGGPGKHFIFFFCRDFSWSPGGNIIAFWVPEDKDIPARVTLMQLPTRQEIRVRNLFNVVDCKLHWQKNGDYLCVKVDRTPKGTQVSGHQWTSGRGHSAYSVLFGVGGECGSVRGFLVQTSDIFQAHLAPKVSCCIMARNVIIFQQRSVILSCKLSG